jgi:membrane-bound lytic murein transglycosylase D
MLKRQFMKAGFFGIGLFILVAVHGMNSQAPFEPTKIKVEINPAVSHLQAFDSSFIYLNDLPDSILADLPKMNLNAQASQFIKAYIKKNNEDLVKIQERSNFSFSVIDSIFSSYRLPVELKYLAVVESELKTSAYSHVGAAGMWQLMASTAREYSLKVTGKYDERRNLYKSTNAAAKYLKNLYAQYGDWLLVIAAYNSGSGYVDKAIKYTGSKNFWRLQNYLPAETRGHVKRFIATHYFFESHGSITTVTKADAAAYKKVIAAFISKQKMIAAADIAKNDNGDTLPGTQIQVKEK